MKRSVLPVVMLSAFAAQAQEHPYLSRFELFEQQAAVRMEWTMVAGSTCNGIEVWRGTDPDALQLIGRIYGLCGNITSPVDYSFTDASPIEFTTLYYQLVLGTAGPSSIQHIVFFQVLTSEIRIVPNATGDGVDVVLAIALNADVELRCWAADGRLVYAASALSGNRHHIPLGATARGGFIVEAIADKRSITGRFVLQ